MLFLISGRKSREWFDKSRISSLKPRAQGRRQMARSAFHAAAAPIGAMANAIMPIMNIQQASAEDVSDATAHEECRECGSVCGDDEL
jgi:hypothetical protein